MYEIIAGDSSMPSCPASTRRLAKRRSSRSATTWNSMSLAVSPPLMKCTESAPGGRSSRSSVRLLATNDCAMSWPPNVRIGFLLGCDPMNSSSDTRLRSSTANSSSKSDSIFSALFVGSSGAFGSLPDGTGSPLCLTSSLNVILPDAVHMDEVGRAYCARRRARDDDHQVTPPIAAQPEQRLVDLTDHAVGGGHHRDDESLGAPGHGQLAAHLGPRGEGQQGQRGMQARQSLHRVAGLGERDQRLGVQPLADIASGVGNHSALGARHMR